MAREPWPMFELPQLRREIIVTDFDTGRAGHAYDAPVPIGSASTATAPWLMANRGRTASAGRSVGRAAQELPARAWERSDFWWDA